MNASFLPSGEKLEDQQAPTFPNGEMGFWMNGEWGGLGSLTAGETVFVVMNHSFFQEV
jgi:hypothetical protein